MLKFILFPKYTVYPVKFRNQKLVSWGTSVDIPELFWK